MVFKHVLNSTYCITFQFVKRTSCIGMELDKESGIQTASAVDIDILVTRSFA